MGDHMWDDFEIFIRREAGVSPGKALIKTHAIEGDLDITGDEAIEFMEHFFKSFSIKPGDFNFNRHFSVEGFNPVEITLIAFSKMKRQKYAKVPLTLGMLHHAVLDGEWNSERLESLGS